MRLSLFPAAAILAAPFTAQAQTPRERFGDWPMGDWGWGHMVFGGIGMLLFWVVVIALVVFLVRGLSGAGIGGAPRSSALDVLEERFARGEIDRQEFEERRRVLRERRKD